MWQTVAFQSCLLLLHESDEIQPYSGMAFFWHLRVQFLTHHSRKDSFIQVDITDKIHTDLQL